MLVSGAISAETRLFMPPKRANRFWKCLRNFRKHQNGENDVCGTSASVKMEEMTLAELPQASKWGKWPLRDFRKHQNGENGSCGTSASVKMEKMAFAGLPQASKWEKWPLRSSRKHQKVFRGTCGTPASLLVWRKPKKGSGKNDRVLGDKCIGSNGFALAKKRQSVGIDEDGA